MRLFVLFDCKAIPDGIARLVKRSDGLQRSGKAVQLVIILFQAPTCSFSSHRNTFFALLNLCCDHCLLHVLLRGNTVSEQNVVSVHEGIVVSFIRRGSNDRALPFPLEVYIDTGGDIKYGVTQLTLGYVFHAPLIYTFLPANAQYSKNENRTWCGQMGEYMHNPHTPDTAGTIPRCPPVDHIRCTIRISHDDL